MKDTDTVLLRCLTLLALIPTFVTVLLVTIFFLSVISNPFFDLAGIAALP